MSSDRSAAEVFSIIVPRTSVEWLREFMTEVNTQDNRATATPYYYELRYTDEEEGGVEKRVDYGQCIFFTEKAALDYIDAQQHNLPKGVYTFLCWGGRNKELQQLLENIGRVVGVPYERK